MLEDLPSEIIFHIAAHLPAASSIICLSQTCQRLHDVISNDDYGIFRAFVQARFPSVKVPPYWKDAAHALTSRSRAWDRRAFIARLVQPAEATRLPRRSDRPELGGNQRRQIMGYTPIIDSYEAWTGGSWADRKKVLVWGAGSELIMRVNDRDCSRREGKQRDASGKRRSEVRHTKTRSQDHWTIYNELDQPSGHDDITGVQLLKPHQRLGEMLGEDIILGRLNGTLVHLSLDWQGYVCKKAYDIGGRQIHRTAMSPAAMPLLAACSNGEPHISIFDVHAQERTVKPRACLTFETRGQPETDQISPDPSWIMCSRFLSEDRLAIGLSGYQIPLHIYRLNPDHISEEHIRSFEDSYDDSGWRHHAASAIAPLETSSQIGCRPGDIFLTGWYQGLVRLFDTRSPNPCVASYLDTVDTGSIYSLLPIGHERFLAGSGQNGVLKTFDLRIPGGRMYSYLEAGPLSHSSCSSLLNSPEPGIIHTASDGVGVFQSGSSNATYPSSTPIRRTRRDINIFLNVPLTTSYGNRRNGRRTASGTDKYSGPVYSLSTPSPSSPTVYAGIENHVVRLDFTSTDDILGPKRDWYEREIDIGKTDNSVLNLGCYERPDDGRESVILHKQQDLDLVNGWTGSGEGDAAEEGWDERWRVPRKEDLWRRR